MKKFTFTIGFLLLFLSAYTQIIQNGKVLDEGSGKPLPGAAIKTHSGKQTLTDQEGNFSIRLSPADSSIYVTYIGYLAQNIKILSGNVSIIVLLKQSENSLQEVIISSGYQDLPKERATGSFTQLDNKRFNEQIGTDVLSRLPAIANGMTLDKTVDNRGRLLVRGISTIRGPVAPLVILDNFPYEGDLQNLNPNLVESITVLKDAAAASIWGARAGNGVIVITTKKGNYNNPIRVDLTAANTIGSKPDLSYLRQVSSSEFINAEEELFNKGYYNSNIASINRPQLSPIVELLILRNAGQITEAEYKSQTDYLRTLDVRDEFNRYFYRPSFNQQYALNLSGGTEQHSWSASSGFDKNRSELNEGFQRTNLRFQNKFRPIPNLQLSADLIYTQNNRTSGKPGYGEIIASVSDLYPYARFADNDGNPLTIAKRRQTYINTVGQGKLLDWNYYPLTDYEHSSNNSDLNEMLLNTGINYKFFKGFSADLKFQYQRQQSNGRNHRDSESYFARDLVNTYTQINSGTGNVSYMVPPGGVLDLSNGVVSSQNLRGQFNYSNSWGNHELNIIAGQELRNTRTVSDNYRIYGYNGDILTFGSVDYNTPFPQFISGSTSYIPQNNSINDKVIRFVSLYSNAAYSYKSRYTLTGSARRDASNLFGLSTNNKWTPLWSVGGSWEVSNEPFYKEGFLHYLRIRATYGSNGNIDPAMSTVSTIRYVGTHTYMPGVVYAQFNGFANPGLTWETSNTTNLGIDFKIRSSNLSGSIDFYQKNGKNLFGYEQLDYTGGIGTNILKNTASIRGRGVDIELNSKNISTANFQWNTHFNFNFNKEKVLSYYLLSDAANLFVGNTYSGISAIEGTPVYSIFSYRWAGLNPNTGDPIGYVNNQPSQNYSQIVFSGKVDDLRFHGPALPVYFGSIGNTITYKRFSLTARLSYKMGYFFRRQSISYSAMFSNYRSDIDFSQRWLVPGDESRTQVPSMIYTNNTSRDDFYAGSENLVERGDHVRLQYINLNYQPDIKKFSRLFQNNLNLFFNINDLGIIWKANKHNIDPDYRGIHVLKPAATYSLGLRVNFK